MKKKIGPWLSIPQYAEKYGYSQAGVRKWLEQLERDTRVTVEQRVAMVHGPRRARRINEERFAIWLALPREQYKGEAAVFVFNAPTIQ